MFLGDSPSLTSLKVPIFYIFSFLMTGTMFIHWHFSSSSWQRLLLVLPRLLQCFKSASIELSGPGWFQYTTFLKHLKCILHLILDISIHLLKWGMLSFWVPTPFLWLTTIEYVSLGVTCFFSHSPLSSRPSFSLPPFLASFQTCHYNLSLVTHFVP